MKLSPKEMMGVGRTGSLVVKGIHRKSKKYVAIKIIEKKKMLASKIDAIREYI